MAAGLGFKNFNTGEVLTSADVNGYLMQGVLVFASEAARNAAITSPQEGQFAYTKDNNSLWYYTGSVWAASGATGDIEGVTAGTGISGGGTSGTVTITNSMATEIDAKGDLIVGTGADTFSRLAVGTNGQVLTADSGETTGLKFATPAAGGGWTQIGSTINLNGATNYTINTTSGYRNWVIELDDPYGASGDINPYIYFNGDTTNANYRGCVVRTIPGNFQSAAIDTPTVFYFALQAASTNDSYCQIQVFDPDATTHRKGFNCNSVITESGSAPQVSTVMFQWENAAAITSVRVQTDTGVNFAGGTFKMWGLK